MNGPSNSQYRRNAPGLAHRQGAAVWLLAASLLAPWFASAARAQGGPPPARVRVATATVQTLQDRRDVIGRLEAVRFGPVAAEQPGKIVELAVDEGDAVVGGETVLARIDGVLTRVDLGRAEAELREAEALVAERQAQLDRATRDYERLKSLIARDAADRKEVEDAMTDMQAADAQLTAAHAAVAAGEARVSLISERIEKLTVRAPYDGVVTRKLVELGQWVGEGAGVVELVSTGPIDAVIDVPESLIQTVQRGQEVEVGVPAVAAEVVGDVVAVIPRGANAARTFPVKVRLANDDGQLLAGMSVIAHVVTRQSGDFLTVPRDAVQRSADGAVVWIVTGAAEQPVAGRVQVRVLFGSGDRFAIRPIGGGGQLGEGMDVGIEGAEGIMFPGQTLAITEATVPPPDARP